MIIVDCEQGSQEWHLARRGIPTASNFDKVITPAKGQPSSQQEGYIDELIGDLMSIYFPPTAEAYTNAAIRHGQQTEAEARHWFSLEAEEEVEQVGFCLTDDGRFGFSPDGLIGTEGGLELKCPLAKTHAGYLRRGVLPPEYKPQVHGALLVGGGLLPLAERPTVPEVISYLAHRGLHGRHVPSSRKWWTFCSYHPGMPALRVDVRPDEYTQKLGEALVAFNEKYALALNAVRSL